MKIDVILLNVSINLLLLAIVQTVFFFYYIKDMIADATLVPLKEVIDDYNHCSLYLPRENQFYRKIYKNILENIDDSQANEAKSRREAANKSLLNRMVIINIILFAIVAVFSTITFLRKNITIKEYLSTIGFVLGGFSTEFIFFFTVASNYQYITGIELISNIFSLLADLQK